MMKKIANGKLYIERFGNKIFMEDHNDGSSMIITLDNTEGHMEGEKDGFIFRGWLDWVALNKVLRATSIDEVLDIMNDRDNIDTYYDFDEEVEPTQWDNPFEDCE